MKNYEEIELKYNELKKNHDIYLKKFGVQIPSLKRANKYTLNALVLIYLYNNLSKVVTKQELTEYLRGLGFYISDVQQARHLAQQSGWYILSGKRGDSECRMYNISAGEYMLKTVNEPYPSYKKMKRTETLTTTNFVDLKNNYGNRCATCGSKEGKLNYMYPASITMLQQGHKNPSRPLTIDNSIPQCQFCNRASKNYFVFDNKGRVEKIYDPHFIMRSEREIQIIMLKLLIEENFEQAKEIIDEIRE
ncbi:MAG: hypothetical protein ACK5HP_05155 [Bacilli bacterium]